MFFSRFPLFFSPKIKKCVFIRARPEQRELRAVTSSHLECVWCAKVVGVLSFGFFREKSRAATRPQKVTCIKRFFSADFGGSEQREGVRKTCKARGFCAKTEQLRENSRNLRGNRKRFARNRFLRVNA